MNSTSTSVPLLPHTHTHTYPHTPVAPGDYTATIVALFFDHDSTRRCVNVPIVTDSIMEDPEYFCGNLDTFDASVLLDPDKANVTIIDAGKDSI